MTVELADLEVRLGGPLPDVYRAFIGSQPASSIVERGFDPKTLLVLNLELRELERGQDDGSSRGRLFLTGDGCGNYFFVELSREADTVLLLSHDPPGVEDPEHHLMEFLDEAEQDHRIDLPPEDGELYICRTPMHAESILDPIGLDEWIAAVGQIDGLEHVGYRERINPFTREVLRIESPGLVAVRGRPDEQISFQYGRARLEPSLQAIGAELATRLGARLVGDTD